MKILITGGNGMVGRNILEHTEASKLQMLSPTSVELNILNKGEIDSYLYLHQPDMIIHAAGIVGGIQANMAEPVRFLVDNMQMGLNVLTSARANGIKKFMNLSSSCMYPRNAINPLGESLVLKGELEPTNEGYALAKIVSTRLCEYITREDKNFQYKTIVPCNIYGRHDKFKEENSHMIPAVIKKITEAGQGNIKAVEIWGDGEARREFMYAGDLADFIYYGINKFEDMPQNINVGLGHDHSINEYYQEIANVIGFNGSFMHDLAKPVGMKQKLIDVTVLRDFGWEHKTTLSDGLKQTYEYYLDEVNV